MKNTVWPAVVAACWIAVGATLGVSWRHLAEWRSDVAGPWVIPVLVLCGLLAFMIAIIMLHTGRSSGGNAFIRIRRLGPRIAAGIWCLGVLGSFLFFVFGPSDWCGGSNGLTSFQCVNQPGTALKSLGLLSAALTLPALIGLFFSARRSPVAGWLAPAVIVALYTLGWLLWAPHNGFGVVPHSRLGLP
jgi:hypothetical protein